MASNTAEELERFRQQWQEEVTARSKATSITSASKFGRPPQRSNGAVIPERNAGPSLPRSTRDTEEHHNLDYYGYHDLEDKNNGQKVGKAGEEVLPSNREEPTSALEHYERAAERESEGNLGDSLSLYRKAYKLDAGVDRIYKNKHFPPSSFKSKPADPNPSGAAVTVPNTAHHSLDGPPASSASQLVASFSSLSILPTDPPTDASPSPPCPISTLPSEILIQILLHTGVIDVASFIRLSHVCKYLAYLTTAEDRIWKRICRGSEVGFAAMHYKWACTITGHTLPMSIDDLDEIDEHLSKFDINSTTANPEPFPLSPKYPSYKNMFHTRPRIRFNGCYISTVNYIRPGGATATQLTWSTPVHIVTYYRYLRFFRDGTCASLLTTTEPADVVHHLTKENIHTQHASGLPSSVMNNCLRGRWKLSGDPYKVKQTQPIPSPTNDPDIETPNKEEKGVEKEEEGTLHIETEGADAIHPNPKYIYKMMLSLKSATKTTRGSTRNNKLAWMGYWSYNKMTDDWAEFGLKNDKAYFWSRVRSYGDGE